MNIGNLFLTLLADGAKLGPSVTAEAQKAGDAGAKTLSQSLTAGLRTNAVKAFGLATAGAFAIAAKGGSELLDIQARYQAETGASADEAKAAGATINRVAGSQRMSLDQVSEAAIRVRRDLGLVGPEADKMTETIVKFARVTRQDAGAAVSQLDDILDSWGLTAADADGVLNKLLVSQHKFGGEISETSKTLAALAPAMRAANMSVDDGIALLGLFGAKGLDAGQASAAFAKALTKVKSPEELQQLITDISNTEDPFARAQKAADLFGAKAGAKLANALAGAHLDDYKISMEEAAGATDKAADALDSTFGAQIKKKISEAGAALRQFGADFGPALTGAAGLASLLATAGGDKLIAGLAKKLGSSGAASVLSGAASKLGGTLGKALGIGISSAAALSIEEGIADAVSGGAKGKIGTAAGKLGDFLGTKLGKGLSLAFAAIAVVEVINTYNDIKGQLGEQTEQIGKDVGTQLVTGTVDGLKTSKAALEQGLADLNGVFDAGLFTNDTRAKLQAQLDAVNAEISKRAQQIPTTIAQDIENGRPAIQASMTNVAQDVQHGTANAADEAKGTALDIPQAIADGIWAARDKVNSAMSALREAMLHELSPAKERANLIGDLTGKELAKGLRSKDPVVKAAAENARSVMLARLEQLVPASGKIGKKQGAELAKALKSKDPQVRAAAQAIKRTIEKKLDETKAKKAGQTVGSRIRSGMLDKKTTIGNAAAQLARAIIRRLIGAINNAAKSGTVNGVIVGDPHRATGGPVTRGRAYVVGEKRPELFVPNVSGTIIPNVPGLDGGGTGGGGDSYEINFDGALPVRGIKDVVTGMRRISDARVAPKRRASPLYPVMPGRLDR